ncbi:MAG TPA: ABC transporter transmembrane domain-containing protein, partial [Planctomycetota bacterium]|nr:ABC transporter transmembrane domain-containing protein [Planctomycetota bacterium]
MKPGSISALIRRKREESQRPAPVLALLARYPWQTAAAALTGLVVGMLGWAVAIFVQSVVDRTRDLDSLGLFALGVTVVLLIRGAVSLVRREIQVRLARTIETELSGRFLDHVTRLEMRFYENYHNGDLLGRLRGVEVLRNAIEDRFLGVLFDALLVLIAAVLMFLRSVPLTLIAVAGATFPAVLILLLRNRIKSSFVEIRERDGDYTNHCMDALLGVRDMRLTEGESWILSRIKESLRRLQDYRVGQVMMLTAVSAVTIFVSTIAGIGLLLLGAWKINEGSLSQGQLMFLFTMSGTMLGPLEQLASTWITFDEASVAYSRYSEILSLPAEAREAVSTPLPIQGAIRLDDVSFGYHPDQPILSRVD